jgi:hypothetical protein
LDLLLASILDLFVEVGSFMVIMKIIYILILYHSL